MAPLQGDLLPGVSPRRPRSAPDAAAADRRRPALAPPLAALQNPPKLYRTVNIVGNHDIGYAAQADESHIARFEAGFGDVNTKFQVGRHLFVVLNSINLDPSKSRVRPDAGRPPGNQALLADAESGDQGARLELQYLYDLTWKHVEEMAKLREETEPLTVVLLTHIPLYKPEGLCADPPTLEFNRYAGAAVGGRVLPPTPGTKGLACVPLRTVGLRRFGQVQQQNVLSRNVTHLLLDKLRPQFIFTGHDHEGCEYRHALPGGGEAREITVRSVQAEYGGHAQLFAIGPTPKPGAARRSRYGLSTCAFHTHIELKVVAGVAAGSLAFLVLWELLTLLYDGLAAVVRRLRGRRAPAAATKLKTT